MKLTNIKKWVIFLLTIIFSVYLYNSKILDSIIVSLGDFQIIGVLIAGMLFVYTFTVAPATALLIISTRTINPLIVAFIGAIGAMIGAIFLYNLFKRYLPKQIGKTINKIELRGFKKKTLKWVIPLIAAVILATPIPDEVAIALLETNKIDANTFMLFAFICAFIGLLIITEIVYLF
ncbi:MAG: hypothetical protein WCX73_00965 [Candidatus Pacearchaeota archaeon]|jgi:hypothetical protein